MGLIYLLGMQRIWRKVSFISLSNTKNATQARFSDKISLIALECPNRVQATSEHTILSRTFVGRAVSLYSCHSCRKRCIMDEEQLIHKVEMRIYLSIPPLTTKT